MVGFFDGLKVVFFVGQGDGLNVASGFVGLVDVDFRVFGFFDGL